MIKGSKLINLTMLSGRELENNFCVDNLIFSIKNFKLLALRVKQKKQHHKGVQILPFDDIKKINNDGLMFTSYKQIIDVNQIPRVKEAYYNPINILGSYIYTNKGDLVGIIKDTIIKKNNGKIIAFIISEGVYNDLICGYSLLPNINCVSMQDDYIVINDNVLKSILHKESGLKKILGIE